MGKGKGQECLAEITIGCQNNGPGWERARHGASCQCEKLKSIHNNMVPHCGANWVEL